MSSVSSSSTTSTTMSSSSLPASSLTRPGAMLPRGIVHPTPVRSVAAPGGSSRPVSPGSSTSYSSAAGSPVMGPSAAAAAAAMIAASRRSPSAQPPVALTCFQAVPFVGLRPNTIPPMTHCLPLFRDAVGLQHFFSGNQRGSLFLVLTLQDTTLPRFPQGFLDAGITLRTWCDDGEGGSPVDAPKLFEIDSVKGTAPDTLTVRLNLLVTGPGKDNSVANRIYFLHVRVEYAGMVFAVQTDRLRILSKPRRVLVAGLNVPEGREMRDIWQPLQSTEPSHLGAYSLPGTLRSSEQVPKEFETPLHRSLLVALLDQFATTAAEQVQVLDFNTTALCAHFLDEHLSSAHKSGLKLCLAPRRPRPDPVDHAHYFAVYVTSAAPEARHSVRRWVAANTTPGTTHGEDLLLQFLLAVQQSAVSARAPVSVPVQATIVPAVSAPFATVSVPMSLPAMASTPATSVSAVPPQMMLPWNPELVTFGGMPSLASWGASGPMPTPALWSSPMASMAPMGLPAAASMFSTMFPFQAPHQQHLMQAMMPTFAMAGAQSAAFNAYIRAATAASAPAVPAEPAASKSAFRRVSDVHQPDAKFRRVEAAVHAM